MGRIRRQAARHFPLSVNAVSFLSGLWVCKQKPHVSSCRLNTSVSPLSKSVWSQQIQFSKYAKTHACQQKPPRNFCFFLSASLWAKNSQNHIIFDFPWAHPDEKSLNQNNHCNFPVAKILRKIARLTHRPFCARHIECRSPWQRGPDKIRSLLRFAQLFLPTDGFVAIKNRSSCYVSSGHNGFGCVKHTRTLSQIFPH